MDQANVYSNLHENRKLTKTKDRVIFSMVENYSFQKPFQCVYVYIYILTFIHAPKIIVNNKINKTRNLTSISSLYKQNMTKIIAQFCDADGDSNTLHFIPVGNLYS